MSNFVNNYNNINMNNMNNMNNPNKNVRIANVNNRVINSGANNYSEFNPNATSSNGSINPRDAYNMKKIKKLNSVDQVYNKDDLKNLIIRPEKIEKPNINIGNLIESRKVDNVKDLEESTKKRVNNPYKGIIKDFNYQKEIKKQKDLVVHTVTEADKDKVVFDDKMGKFQTTIKTQNDEIKDIYSIDKQTKHKKDFEYQHKYKYRSKLDNVDESDLRVDRIEYYKKEQQKLEDSKKKIDNILLDLIDSGILSENLDSVDLDKIDTDKLEETLKNTLGEDEYAKLIKELN